MNRILGALAASAFAMSIGTSAIASTSAKTTATSKTTVKCAKGTHMVNGYTTKKGVKVKAYCKK